MQVAICARNAEGVELACKELGPDGQVIGASVDASDHPALEAWVQEYAERLGGVDVIVSNASALGGIPHSPEGWRRNFEVDVMSAVTFVDAALPFLQQQRRRQHRPDRDDHGGREPLLPGRRAQLRADEGRSW